MKNLMAERWDIVGNFISLHQVRKLLFLTVVLYANEFQLNLNYDSILSLLISIPFMEELLVGPILS